jgi:hypothetical protein
LEDAYIIISRYWNYYKCAVQTIVATITNEQ